MSRILFDPFESEEREEVVKEPKSLREFLFLPETGEKWVG